MHAECAAKLLARHAETDERVAWRGPDAFPDAIGHDRRRDRPRRGGQQEEHPRDRRHRVSGRRDLLEPLRPIRRRAGDDARDGADALVERVDGGVAVRREADLQHQIGRQHAHHHFRGEVGEEAGDAKEPHYRGHAKGEQPRLRIHIGGRWRREIQPDRYYLREIGEESSS